MRGVGRRHEQKAGRVGLSHASIDSGRAWSGAANALLPGKAFLSRTNRFVPADAT